MSIDQELLQQQLANAGKSEKMADLHNSLVLSRVAGQNCSAENRLDLPGSQQWLIGNTAEHQCWICNHHRFTVIFWSKAHCQNQQTMDTIDEDEYYQGKAEELFAAWQAVQPGPTPEKLVKAQKKYGKEANGYEGDRVMISGSFNDWTPLNMVRLTELLYEIDTDRPDIIEMMKA